MSDNMLMNFIILGAGKPYSGTSHSGLRHINSGGSVLDWTIHAIKPYAKNIQFVGGYQIERVFQRYPNLIYTNNTAWEEGGSVESLFHANIQNDAPAVILYNDIIFRPQIIPRLLDAYDGTSVIVAFDSTYPDRYRRHQVTPPKNTETINGGEFVGIFIAPPEHIEKILSFRNGKEREALKKAHLSTLITLMIEAGTPAKFVDICGEWSDLNIPSSITKFIMGTKAETLWRLEGKLKSAYICPQYRFTAKDFIHDNSSVIDGIRTAFPSERLAVRSSSLTEDGFKTANAGVFESVLNVESKPDRLDAAITTVLESLPQDGQEHQIFVQPMVQDVTASGVVLTRSLKTGAPYITINYTIGSKTDAITSGLTGGKDQTLILYRGYNQFPQETPEWASSLVKACSEIEFMLDFDALDIEFAISGKNNVNILQVRPIVLSEKRVIDDHTIQKSLELGIHKFKELNRNNAHPAGAKTIFGIMPDWNPAEIIGIRPNILASTLYDALITNETWARQRAEYGYQDVRPSPLITLLCGQPYIDVRSSFGSFTPAAMSRDETRNLVSFYLNWLETNPHLHDKVEFDVVPTCYTLDFEKWENRLDQAPKIGAETIQKLKKSLLDITNLAFIRALDDYKNMNDGDEQINEIIHSAISPLKKALSLLDICKRKGTLNFSHLARSAFVAIALLRSIVKKGLLSENRLQEFLLSIRTVSSEFSQDAYLVKTQHMKRDEFVKKYGHLRPGTYDANCNRYDRAPDFYLDSAIHSATEPQKHSFVLTQEEEMAIDAAFKSHGLKITANKFMDFCKIAIEGREFSKFIFTKSLSAALEFLKIAVAGFGIPAEDAVHIPLQQYQIIDFGACPEDIKTTLLLIIEENKNSAEITKMIELPPLICNKNDFMAFFYRNAQANFVTQNNVTARIIPVNSHSQDNGTIDIKGKIALIDAADPGYDWIFGHEISGLITKYGGANSHMSIRCAEFGIPAAIGVGETLYKKLQDCENIELDCKQKIIRILR